VVGIAIKGRKKDREGQVRQSEGSLYKWKNPGPGRHQKSILKK